jgi:hypothetical protein
MSLERKSAKKQMIDLGSAKRESNFNKLPVDPKAIKIKTTSSQHDDASSDKFRKQTLSPPQSSKDNLSAKGQPATITKQKMIASTLSKTKKISYIKQLVKKSQQKSLSRDFNSN